METKFTKSNVIIGMSTLIIVICTLLIALGSQQTEQFTDDEISNIKSVSYSDYVTPPTLSKDNEREDICEWAKAQKGISEAKGTQTPFHAHFGMKNEAWCQMFVNWCSIMAGTLESNFVRTSGGSNCFHCATCFAGYDTLGGNDRSTTSTSGLEKGWVRYEGSAKKPSHAALYVGNDEYAHGNWSDAVHVTKTSGMGTLKGFGKPYYRSKVYYNLNQTGASFNGYTYPNKYSAWYTEEQTYTLASSGPSCSGKTFQGWYTTSACTTKISSISTSTRGAVNVYAGWSGGTTTTPTPSETPTETPTEEPEVYWQITHHINGGYFTGSYPTYYREGYGCIIPTNNAARTGYDFLGWYDYSYGGYRVRIYGHDRGDKDLYAQWRAKKYPLYLYSQKGKVSDRSYSFTNLGNYYYRYNKQYTYDQVEYLPKQPGGVDRRGHNFGGWYKDSNYTDGPYTNLKKGTIGTQIFYAKWTPKVYDLILHTNGGTVINTVIDDGKVIGDDIIGTYTYGKGSTFPKANGDIYKKDRIFAGWYDNKNLSGTPHTGIRSGDDDTAPIGDKEYWARWIGIVPNAPKNDATELTKDNFMLYVYYTYRIDEEDGKGVTRKSISIAENKRFFCVDLKTDPSTSSSSAVKVWLSTNKDPESTDQVLTNWTMKSTKSCSGSGGVYKTYDNSTLTFTCPSDIETILDENGGSTKVYVHVETVTGNRGVYGVNVVKRALYAQH